MKISELSSEEQEEQRARWREAQQRTRARQRAERIPMADEWTRNWSEEFPKQREELNAVEKEFLAQVGKELGQTFSIYSEQAYTLSVVATTLHCLRKNCSPWTRQVQEGLIVGGLFFAEALGSDLVKSVHRYDLERSPTFADAYRQLLRMLDKRFSQVVTKDHYEAKCIADVKTEISLLTAA